MDKKPRARFQAEQDRLDHEQEKSNGEYGKMKIVFQKKIQFYNRFIAEDNLTELDRLILSNKREWIMAHLLGLTEHEDNVNKISELTKRVHALEMKTAELEEFFKNGGYGRNSSP